MGACSSDDRDSQPIHLLRPTPFGTRLNEQQLDAFAKYFRTRRYPKRTDIFIEDQPGGDFYQIVEGEVELRVSKSVLCVKSVGDSLGFSTLEDGVRTATATCKTDVTVLELTADNLKAYLRDCPEAKDFLLPLLGQTAEQLSRIEIFHGIPPKKIMILGIVMRTVALRAGDTLFEEGSLGNSLYLVSSGILSAQAVGNDSKVKELAKFGPGDVFGEIALIMDIPRTATIIAIKDALLFELPRDSFQKFLKIIPGQNLNIHEVLKTRTAEHFRRYKVPFFEAIPDSKYPILASLCKIDEHPPNHIIFQEGDVGHDFHMIAFGSVRVTVKKSKEELEKAANAKAAKKGKDGKEDTSNSSSKNESKAALLADKKKDKEKEGKGQDIELAPLGDDEIEICRMGPGKYFGEIALVQDTKRTATVTTVSKCVILSITKDNFEKFFHEAPEAIADFEVKLARYHIQLRSVIYHPLGLEYFTQHLRAEFSEENINFWKECRDFRHLSYQDIAHESEDEKGGEQAAQGPPALPSPRGSIVAGEEAKYTLLTDEELSQAPSALKETEERKRHDIVSAFALFSVGDSGGVTIKQLQATLTLLGITCDSKIAEQVAGLMSINLNGLITQEGFMSALIKYSSRSRDSMDFAERIVHKMNRAIQDSHLSKLKLAFDLFDSDKSGNIDFREFTEVMKSLGLDGEKGVTAEQFKKIDKEGSGSVSFPQFVEFMIAEKQNKARFHALLLSRAQFIFDTYVSAQAPQQVNIRGPTRDSVRDEIASGKVSNRTFDKAEKEILKLMSTDSFNRFKQSPLFQEFLNQAQSYTHVETKNKNGREEGKTRSGAAPQASVLVRSGSFKKDNAAIDLDQLVVKLGDDESKEKIRADIDAEREKERRQQVETF